MTYSRPTCLALIARVESGLTFGQLQPYADALREAVGEVERLVAERIAGATGLDNEIVLMLRGERDDARRQRDALKAKYDAAALASYRELDLARARIAELEASIESHNESIDREVEELTAERDRLRERCEIDGLLHKHRSTTP